jgi:rsbT co-antagonist protein RsbR
MMPREANRTVQTLLDNQAAILAAWLEGQLNDARIPRDLMSAEDLSSDSRQLLDALVAATASGNLADCDAPAYSPVKNLLADVALRREQQGLTHAAIAASIMCLKDAWGPFLQAEYKEEPDLLNREIVVLSKLVDTLALITLEGIIKRREDVISRQAREILEISTPVVQVWDGVVAAPLIGALDSQRTQQFMERLLERIVETSSPVALVDITGVPVIDTQTAQHLVETMSAVKLLGAQVVLTGVRPVIAQTLVHLGIDLSEITTRASLAAGLRVAFDFLEVQVVSKNGSR